MLDVFKSDAFGLVSMTTALEKLPYKPGRLGELGLFDEQGITTTVVVMEESQGKLSLVQTAARGSMPRVQTTPKRLTRAFPVVHLPQNDTVMADEVQGIRKFGTEDDTEGVAQVVNNKMQRLKQNLEATMEWHRVGAVLGKTYDADGTSLLFDWYDEFGITQQVIDFDFSTTVDVAERALAVQQLMEDNLGAATYTGIRAICGNQFFRDLISHASVKDAFRTWQTGSGGNVDGVFTLQDAKKKRAGFLFAGIVWENYRGYIGSQPFIPTRECRFIAEGVPELFKINYAPGPFIETVNTVGKPMYAKQRVMDFDVGVEIHLLSCPLAWCSRPACIIRGIATGDVAGYYNMPAGPLQ